MLWRVAGSVLEVEVEVEARHTVSLVTMMDRGAPQDTAALMAFKANTMECLKAPVRQRHTHMFARTKLGQREERDEAAH